MADMAKLVCTWTGFVGAPGYTVFYFDGLVGFPSAVTTFWQNIKAYLPSAVTVTPAGGGYIINPATGIASGTWTAAGASGTTGTGTGNYSAASGSCVTWITGALNRNGHPLRGRSFIVPNSQNAYATDGTLDATYMGALYTACTSLKTATSSKLAAWSRPLPSGVPGGPSPGQLAVVTDALIRDKVAVLRSRRD
jgi:hypothetical protein